MKNVRRQLTFFTHSEVTSAIIYFFIFLFFVNFSNKDFLFPVVLSFYKLKMRISTGKKICEINKTHFRTLPLPLQHKILIFASGTNRQKKKKEAASRCDLGASIGCEPFRRAFNPQRLLAQMLAASFFFFVRHSNKLVFFSFCC